MSFTYEQVIEDKVYGDENSGRPKEKENLASLLRARKIFKKKYGELIVTFGNSLQVEDYVTQSKDSRTAVNAMGLDISRRIRDQSYVTLTGLAYAALLSSPTYGLTRTELISSIKELAEHAALSQATIAELESRSSTKLVSPLSTPAFTKSLTSFLAGGEELLADVLKNGFIQYESVLGEDVLFVRGQKRFSAEFYKNSVMHLFVIPSLVATLQERFGKASWEHLHKLHDWLEVDFILAPWPKFKEEILAYMQRYAAKGYATVSEESITLHPHTPGWKILQELFSATLESHWWVLEHIRVGLRGAASGEFQYKTFESKLISESRTAIFAGVIHRTEAGSQANVLSAIETLASLKLVSIGEKGGKRSTLTVSQFPRDMYEFLAALLGKTQPFPTLNSPVG